MVGSGPFRLVEGTAGGSLYRFEANPDYWAGAPHIDEVVFRVYKSEDPAVQALIKGEVDFVENITALQVKSLKDRAGITATLGDSPASRRSPSTPARSAPRPASRRVTATRRSRTQPSGTRSAMPSTTTVVERVYQGAGEVGYTIIPPAYPDFHWAPSDEDAFKYDPDLAGQMLDDAGYTMGDDGKRTMPDGGPIGTIRLYARSESPTSLDTMNFFKEWLGDLGIDAEVKAYEDNNLTGIIIDGNFDAFAWGWFVEPDPNSMLSYMTCDQLGVWSDSWYCDEDYDAMFASQNAETDEAARIETVKQMQQQLYEDSPYLVTTYDKIGEAFRSDRFACLQPQPDPGGIWLMQYGVSSYLSIRPADEAGDCGGLENATEATEAGDDGSISTGMLVGLGVAAGAVVIAGAVVMMRRRRTVGDRE